MNIDQIALRFHELYEELAPQFGYETRADTKRFDPESPNGKLMIAVCGRLLAEVAKQEPDSIERRKSEWATMDAAINEYSEGYEYGDTGYTPTKQELAMCHDFLQGLIADDAFIAAIASVYPVRSRYTAPPIPADKMLVPREHWVLDAAKQCIPFAVRCPEGKEDWHRAHLLQMLDKMDADMSVAKANRWLGWIQACLCFNGVATLEQMKDINREASAMLAAAKVLVPREPTENDVTAYCAGWLASFSKDNPFHDVECTDEDRKHIRAGIVAMLAAAKEE